MYRFGSERRRVIPGRTVARLLATSALVFCCTEAVQVGEQIGSAPVSSLGGDAGAPIGTAGSTVDLFTPNPAPANTDEFKAQDASAGGCQPVPCGNRVFACGNCIDDDGDGLIDAADPECLGPCDDSEAELFSGTAPRVNGSCRTDCYFDRNAGSGDDGCSWSYRCDPLAVGPEFPPTGDQRCAYDASAPACTLSDPERSACEQGCLPLTPNGCDCFGCCELPAGSGEYRWLGSESGDLDHCEFATSADRGRCPPCTPVADCFNPCDECELCLGKASLPASCSTGTGTLQPSCPAGVVACDPRNPSACTALEYCITGCCIPLPR